MPTTYHRLGNIFYKADQGLIKSVKFSSDYILIECVESLPEDAIEIKGDEYARRFSQRLSSDSSARIPSLLSREKIG